MIRTQPFSLHELYFSDFFLKVLFFTTYLDDCSNKHFFKLTELYLIVILNYSEFGLHTHESQLNYSNKFIIFVVFNTTSTNNTTKIINLLLYLIEIHEYGVRSPNSI